jgi:hypothetical protein
MKQAVCRNFAHETAICRNPHNSSNWYPHFTWHLCHKHTFCQSLVSTKILLLLIFSYRRYVFKCRSIKDLWNFFVSYVSVGYDKLLFHERNYDKLLVSWVKLRQIAVSWAKLRQTACFMGEITTNCSFMSALTAWSSAIRRYSQNCQARCCRNVGVAQELLVSALTAISYRENLKCPWCSSKFRCV